MDIKINQRVGDGEISLSSTINYVSGRLKDFNSLSLLEDITWTKTIKDEDEFLMDTIRKEINDNRKDILITMLSSFDSKINKLLDISSYIMGLSTLEGFNCFLMMRANKMETFSINIKSIKNDSIMLIGLPSSPVAIQKKVRRVTFAPDVHDEFHVTNPLYHKSHRKRSIVQTQPPSPEKKVVEETKIQNELNIQPVGLPINNFPIVQNPFFMQNQGWYPAHLHLHPVIPPMGANLQYFFPQLPQQPAEVNEHRRLASLKKVEEVQLKIASDLELKEKESKNEQETVVEATADKNVSIDQLINHYSDQSKLELDLEEKFKAGLLNFYEKNPLPCAFHNFLNPNFIEKYKISEDVVSFIRKRGVKGIQDYCKRSKIFEFHEHGGFRGLNFIQPNSISVLKSYETDLKIIKKSENILQKQNNKENVNAPKNLYAQAENKVREKNLELGEIERAICYYFKNGKCKFGENCKNYHPGGKAKTPSSPVEREDDWHCPNTICYNHLRGFCFSSKSSCNLCGSLKPTTDNHIRDSDIRRRSHSFDRYDRYDCYDADHDNERDRDYRRRSRSRSFDRYEIDSDLDSCQNSFDRLDLKNIKNGSEHRKIVMLQNIPTTYGYNDLKEELKDFKNVYVENGLRFPMDFANNLKSNYCFIEFPTPNSIINFYRRFEGKTWDKSKASVKARLAWAKVQEAFPKEQICPISTKRKLESPVLESSKILRREEQMTNNIDESKEANYVSRFIANHDASYVQSINDVKILLNNFLKTIPEKRCSVQASFEVLMRKCPQFYQEVKTIGIRKFCQKFPSFLKYSAQKFTDEKISFIPDYVTIGDGISPDYIPKKTRRW